jgi:signal transduction histidine kinase
MSMKYEWTAPGFASDLDDPKYKNVPSNTGYLENWNHAINRGTPYIGDAKHVIHEDMDDLALRGIYAMLDVPIYIDGKWWGTIGFDDMARTRDWSNAEVDALVVAANLLGATIKRQQVDALLQSELEQRKTLIDELEVKNAESETLRESAAIVAATLERSETVQRILEQLKRVVAYDSASVWMYMDDKANMVGWNDLPYGAVVPGEYILSDSEPDHTFRTENAPYILLDDIQENYPIFREPPRNYIHGWMAIPLQARGKLTGFISLDSRTSGKFTEHDAKLVLTFANQVSIALENARLYTELQTELFERQKLIVELVSKNAEAETLRESVAIVAATLEQSEAIDRILEQLGRVLPFDSASVQLVNGEVLEIVSSRGFEFNKSDKYVINKNEPAYPVVQGRVPYILYDDVQVSIPAFNEIPHNNIHAWMAVPLKVKGKIIGIIALDGQKAGQFSERDAQLAVTYANQVAIALENARLFTELQAELSERQKLIDELESKNAELERFTYTVSHDLRSPLVTIKGFLGFMEKSASQGNMESFRKDMQRVSSAADRMDNLLKDVLELSRIGRVINEPHEMPFEDLIHEVLEIVHGRIQQRGITVQIQPGLPAVYGDRPRLMEVLQNLLDNAAKYMGDQKAPIINIGMNGYDESKNPVFFVRDNGMGIDPKFNGRIFGMFDKLDPTSEGTGIGLALVKRIIEVHGGRIWVESQVGKGSTFYLTLPRANHLENFA